MNIQYINLNKIQLGLSTYVFLSNVVFTYYSHCIMCHSYSSTVACDNLEAADWLDEDNAIQIGTFSPINVDGGSTISAESA